MEAVILAVIHLMEKGILKEVSIRLPMNEDR
jgi:hypothetical protein